MRLSVARVGRSGMGQSLAPAGGSGSALLSRGLGFAFVREVGAVDGEGIGCTGRLPTHRVPCWCEVSISAG